MRDDDQQAAIELGHESIGMNARAAAKGFSVLYAFVIVSLLLVAGVMFLFSKILGGDATVDAPAESATLPPGVPTLDSNQSDSLRALRSRERQVLTEYAWVDAEAGIARIPIKRAMEILGQSTNIAPKLPHDDATKP